MRTKSKPAFTMACMRQAFPTWWISVPPGFDVRFDQEGGYWHAWDAHRSISLTSIQLTDPGRGGRRVPVADLMTAMTPMAGEPVDPPPGLAGWAVVIDTVQPARASRAVTGIVAVDGRLLLATITADDVDWATGIWRSIGYGPETGSTSHWELREYPPVPAPAGRAVH